ncbi:transposase [Streptomyces sp. 7R007]
MVGVIRRHELTDHEWELLAPLILRAVTGRPRVEDRKIINGTVYKIRTGISWRDLPARYGPWKTVYTRFRRYALDGVFTRALQQIQAQADAAGDIDWLVHIDSKSASPARTSPGPATSPASSTTSSPTGAATFSWSGSARPSRTHPADPQLRRVPAPGPRRRHRRAHPYPQLRRRRRTHPPSKTIKRQMYGRGSFQLLRTRVLLRS